MRLFSRRGLGIVVGGTVAALGVGAGTATAHGGGYGWKGPRPNEVKVNLPEGNNNPSISNGVAVGGVVAVYTSSGLGPAAAGPSAPPGSPEQYVDLSLFGGTLPAGVTLTEAQSWNALTRIVDNLETMGLHPKNVITMKCYLKRPAGATDADYAGWNRAYRQFFANVDLVTGAAIPMPIGTGAPVRPRVVNAARPARATMEVAGLAVAGWLVEIEVQATYPWH